MRGCCNNRERRLHYSAISSAAHVYFGNAELVCTRKTGCEWRVQVTVVPSRINLTSPVDATSSAYSAIRVIRGLCNPKDKGDIPWILLPPDHPEDSRLVQ